MHQPFYKDALTGRYTLPWVRLHAAKDYLHMAEVLGQYPRVRATFNFVPSLVEQIEDYASGRAVEAWQELSRKPHLDPGELRFGGRGVYLMRALMDEIACESLGERGNRLQLRKRWPAVSEMRECG